VIEPLLLALLAFAPADSVPTGGARADTLARPVRTLPEVDVEAERARLDARRRMPTASITELTPGDAARAIETMDDLLAGVPGARVIQYGGLGAFSALSLRGASPGQVSVFLDGVPLTSAARGVVDLSDLPPSALERIEVYRGVAPLSFGAATPGGAVNLVTRDAPDVRALHVAGGSFGSWEGSGTLGARRGAWSLLADGGYAGSRGDYRFLDDNGTPLNPADDAVVTRLNDRFDAVNALASVGFAPRPDRGVTLRAEGYRKAQGVPGLGAAQAPNPRLALERGSLALEARGAAGESQPHAVLRLSAGGERSRFRDPEGELHLGRQDGTTSDRDLGANLELATPSAWRALSGELGGGLRDERGQGAPPTLGLPLPPASARGTASGYATLRLHLAADRLVIEAGRRWDRQRDALRATLVAGAPLAANATRTLDQPQAGARLSLPLGLEARGNWTRTARAPDFSELFGDQLVVAANPKLLPEQGEGWDATLAWAGGGRAWHAGLEWSRFGTHERDLISWIPAAARTVRATNFSRAELRGEELSAHAAWGALTATGSGGWTSAIQTDPGNIYYGRTLPLRPARQASARLEARLGPFRAGGELLHLGEEFLDPINFQRLPARTLVGASLSYGRGPIAWTLEGRNLGDRRFEDVAGYPLPGRSVFLSCDLRFEPAPRRPR